MFPRPVESLRPIVHCCGIEYNMYERLGKGFSIAELNAVKLNTLRARQLGIAVDTRRVNKSQNSLDTNVARLQEYLKRLVVFKKDANPEEIKAAVQVSRPLPLVKAQPTITTGKISEQPKMDAYKTIHELRMRRVVARKENAKKQAELAKLQK